MNKKKTTAMIMAILIVMLPVYSAVVLGDLSIQRISGDDEAYRAFDRTGYMASLDDTLTVILNSNVPDVRFADNPNNPLDCEVLESGFRCYYIDQNDLDAGVYPLRFLQVINNQQVVSSIQGTLIVDEESPTAQFEIDIRNGKYYGVVSADDTAFGSKRCSGIKEIEFFRKGIRRGKQNETFQYEDCSVSGVEFEYTNLEEGLNTFYAVVTDYTGHEVETNSVDYYVDKTAPKIRDVYLQRGSAKINFIGSSNIQDVYVVLELYDYNLSNGKVFADLSPLTVNPANKLGITDFTCIDKGSMIYQCVSNKAANILITGTSISLEFNLTDAYGNNKVEAKAINVLRDASVPIPLKVGTTNCDSNACYLKQGQNFLEVTFDGSGAGFGNRQVFVKAPSLRIPNMSPLPICEKIGGIWSCKGQTYLAEGTSGDTHQLSTGYPSKNNAGTLVQAAASALIYDGEAPELSGNNPIRFMRRGTTREYLSSNDLLKIELYASDDYSGVKTAAADLSKLITGAGLVEATECNEVSSGEYKCTWLLGSVRPGPAAINSVAFRIYDFAGNYKDVTGGPVTIYTTTDNEVSFWSFDPSQTQTDPAVLDRVISKYVPGALNVWADLKFTAEQNVKLLYADVANCENVGGNYLKSARVYPISAQTKSSGEADVFLVLELRKTDLPDEEYLKFACNMSLTTASGSIIYPYEIVETEVKIPLEISGFDIPANYDEKIQNFKKNLEDPAWLSSAKKLFDGLDKMCNLIKSLVEGFNVLSDMYHLIAAIFGSNTFTKWLEHKTLKGDDFARKSIDDFTFGYGSWICGFSDCTLMDKIVSEQGGSSGWESYNQFINAWILSTTSNYPNQENLQAMYDDRLSAEQAGVKEAAEQSIVFSALSLCIPGIIHNMEKARQIDCMYVDCAERWTQTGLNPYTCEAMRANAYCNFVYGQIFHIVPFSGILEHFGDLLQTFTSSPWAAAGMIQGRLCDIGFYSESVTHYACVLPKRIATWTNFFTGLKVAFSSGDDAPDYCAEIGV